MTELHQLEWKCRRGTLELDLLLGGYLKESYAMAPRNEQVAFQMLLEYPDDQLTDLVTGKEISQDRDVNHVIQRICKHSRSSA